MEPLVQNVQSLAASDQYTFNPHEIADLLGNYYELLSKMHYFSSSHIKYPPHNPAVNTTLAASLGLEPQVVDLLEKLPYIEGINNEDEFIRYGSFADFRDEGVLVQSRDPDFAGPEGGFEEENGAYVMPWVLALNECGNHGSILYYNTRNGHITMLWQGGAGGGCSDPVFENLPDQEGRAHPINKNRIEHYPSRPATDLFADFTNRLLTLEWIPFNNKGYQVFSEGHEEYSEIKQMFLTYDWPDNFDGEGFDDAAWRWKEFNSVQYDIDEVNRRVKALASSKIYLEQRIKKLEADKASTTDIPSSEELSKLDEELEKLKVAFEITVTRLKEAEEEQARWNGLTEAQKMEKGWVKHIEYGIRTNQDHLNFLNGEGKRYYEEEEVRRLKEEIKALEGRLKIVGDLPKTAEQAIRKQHKTGPWACCDYD